MPNITSTFGSTDIYLLDQIMKDRYATNDVVLDAGAGAGRNMYWFVQQGIEIHGTDRSPEAIEQLKQKYPSLPESRFQLTSVENMPFAEGQFNHVICSAVLHFADHHDHFERMFAELARVLKPGGSLFIRMTSDTGLTGPLQEIGDGGRHTYHGGAFDTFPARITVPSTGFWNITLDTVTKRPISVTRKPEIKHSIKIVRRSPSELR